MKEIVITFGSLELEDCKLVAGFRNYVMTSFCAHKGEARGKRVVGADLTEQTLGHLVRASAQYTNSNKTQLDLHNTKQQTRLL